MLTRDSQRSPKIKIISNIIFGPCQEEKIIKPTHKKVKEVLSTKPLELIHMDLMGPSRTVSLCGNSDILIMVDDFTRFTWVAFLKHKSETFRSL